MTGSVRIIAGKWRRRRLCFPATERLRPTPDRIKETLFNWLDARITGARCLDLFAGSGGLGFEAASRGARAVSMVDNNARVVQYLQAQAAELDASEITVVHADGLQWLGAASGRFDVVFLDPPFEPELLERVCRRLSRSACLDVDALVYLECARDVDPLPLPDGFAAIRNRTAGRVRYYLAARE